MMNLGPKVVTLTDGPTAPCMGRKAILKKPRTDAVDGNWVCKGFCLFQLWSERWPFRLGLNLERGSKNASHTPGLAYVTLTHVCAVQTVC